MADVDERKKVRLAHTMAIVIDVQRMKRTEGRKKKRGVASATASPGKGNREAYRIARYLPLLWFC